MRGIKTRSKGTDTPSAMKANTVLYPVLYRAVRSAQATLAMDKAIVPGINHQTTATLGRNRSPKTSGIAIGHATTNKTPKTQEITDTCRMIRHVKSDAPSSRVRTVRGKRAEATAEGICHSASETTTPRA